jgi:hypothetical protein
VYLALLLLLLLLLLLMMMCQRLSAIGGVLVSAEFLLFQSQIQLQGPQHICKKRDARGQQSGKGTICKAVITNTHGDSQTYYSEHVVVLYANLSLKSISADSRICISTTRLKY